MKTSRKWITTTLATVMLAASTFLFMPQADAGVRIIRRPICPAPGYYAPGYYVPAPHVHTYAVQEQRRFVGYNPFGQPIYEVRYVRVRTCGCR